MFYAKRLVKGLIRGRRSSASRAVGSPRAAAWPKARVVRRGGCAELYSCLTVGSAARLVLSPRRAGRPVRAREARGGRGGGRDLLPQPRRVGGPTALRGGRSGGLLGRGGVAVAHRASGSWNDGAVDGRERPVGGVHQSGAASVLRG